MSQGEKSTEYHLLELAIARETADPRHIMPEIPAGCRRILDVGCGMGQTLAARPVPGALACGIDPDFESLKAGRSLRAIRPIAARAEHVPVRDGWAQFVIARLSLPYTHIPHALREIYRVMTRGGVLWAALHPWSRTWADFRSSVIHLNPRSTAYQGYALLNGLVFHLAGRQFRYPLNTRRCESFQTVRGMKTALRRAGFQDVAFSDPGFVVTARKPGAPDRSTTPRGETAPPAPSGP